MSQPRPQPSWLEPIVLAWNRPAQRLLLALVAPVALWFAATAPGAANPPRPWPNLKVDANTAPGAVLEALPGLGPALAGRIDEARTVRPFQSLGDLDRRVKGIGPARAAALSSFLRFDDAP